MAVEELERKVTEIGNSLGVILPKEVIQHIKAKQGDELNFELTNDGAVIIKRHQPLRDDILEDVIDQDFLEGVKDLFDHYDSTLKNLAVRIPNPFAENIGIGYVSEVELELLDSGIIMKPVKTKPTLDDLLAKINGRTNPHLDYDCGKPEGKEFI